MTIDEACRRYNIPLEILHEYEQWGLCGDTDLERLSMIMTLHDIGFKNSEIETYMKKLLEKESGEDQCLKMLEQKRQSILDEIHFREKQLSNLDYLRYNICKDQDTGKSV